MHYYYSISFVHGANNKAAILDSMPVISGCCRPKINTTVLKPFKIPL